MARKPKVSKSTKSVMDEVMKKYGTALKKLSKK